MVKPVVAIIGKPNVGKSTIFNRVVGERVAIVEDVGGVTRDRVYSSAQWLDQRFHIIDTGGIVLSDEPMIEQIREQAEIAMAEADVIVFLADGKEGVTSADEEVANLLYRVRKPVVMAVNKMDNPNRDEQLYEFYSLGLGEPYPISSTHGLGIGDLLDEVVRHFPEVEDEDYDESTIRFSLIGRPNVGKSSLVNALLGQERVIVSQNPGTTREATDSVFTKNGQDYVVIDTAGMRKRGKVYEGTEKYSVLRARRAIERSDVSVLVIDGEEGIIEQDKKIVGYAREAGRALLILVNKWDAVEKDQQTMKKFEKEIRSQFAFIDFAPILFVSARTGKRLDQLLPLIKGAAENHSLRIQTSVLNDVILDAIAMNPPAPRKGRRLKISYATQVSVKPPTFVVFVNDPERLHFSYRRFLENQIRRAFGFQGTPIEIFARKKREGGAS